MKLSLLLKRERFGGILEKTLSRFWSGRLNKEVNVRWLSKEPDRQVWWGNIYLNFFATDSVDCTCFDIVAREFSKARVAWRRPFQWAYVRAASGGRLRRRLAQVYFDVLPDIEVASRSILVGGNRRLRLISPPEGSCTVILKNGFSTQSILRELSARKGAANGLAPRILSIAADRHSFVEEYVLGTPINRLGRRVGKDVRRWAQEVLETSIIGRTARDATVLELASDARDGAERSITNVDLGWHPGEVSAVRRGIDQLFDTIRKRGAEVRVPQVLSHGDFQEANILLAGDRLWVIDWENAAYRSVCYDLATLHSGTRLQRDWVAAWERSAGEWIERGVLPFQLPCGSSWTGDASLALSLLWALEELDFRIGELVPARVSRNSGSAGEIKSAVDRILSAAERFR